MKCKVRDKQPYYEAYNDDGDIIAYGTSASVAEVLGCSAESVVRAAKTNYRYKGVDIINPAVYRRVFDCYHKNRFVCSGTYEEIAEKTGQTEGYVRWAGTERAKEKLKKTMRSDTESMVMLELDRRRLEWLQ